MALEFDINIAAAEHVDEAIESMRAILVLNRFCQRTMAATGQTNQAAGIFSQFVFLNCTRPFRRSQFHARHEPAEVLVTRASFGKKRVEGGEFRISDCGFRIGGDGGCDRDFGADVGKDTRFLCGQVEAG